jgi:hypothetical protein
LYDSITRKLFALPDTCPKLIDEAVPANLRSGCPENGKLPEEPGWGNIRITYAGVPEIDEEWLERHLNEVTLLDVRLEDEVER